VHESGDDNDTGLDEDELEIIKDAGIILRSSKTRRSPQHLAKHVENEEEARQYTTNENTQTMSLSRFENDNITSASDLGWQKPEIKKRERKKDTSAKVVDTTDDTAASERSEAAKVCVPSLSI